MQFVTGFNGLVVFSTLLLSTLLYSSDLSEREANEISEFNVRFYREKRGVMGEIPPKFPLGISRARVSKRLFSKSEKFLQKRRCERFFKPRFPFISCDENPKFLPADPANAESDDKIEDLIETWIPKNNVERRIDRISSNGKSAVSAWSADYWRANWGYTSFRYADGVKYKTYSEAVNAYAQPKEWDGLIGQLEPEKLAERVLRWSPAEKYDLSVGDSSFSMANAQKKDGGEHVGENGIVEEWVGLCDGWSAASVMVAPPMKAIQSFGSRGVPVIWYPEDIRAMLSLAWTNGNYGNNFIGGRCDAKNAETYPNGRLKQQECFDTNPATFHLILGNLLGGLRQPFVMDVMFDAEVWNQPVVAYEIQYFNPFKPEVFSTDWKEMAVSYNADFRKIDRFQAPLTRGKRGSNGKYDDSAISKIVGVVASVTYLDEAEAVHQPESVPPKETRVSYLYDLELAENDRGEWIPVGGEWHQNAHPDFVWIPQSGVYPSLPVDKKVPKFSLESAPESELTRFAADTSRKQSYPLCQVVKALVEASREVLGPPIHCDQ